jgi:hypothetical protein
VLIRGLINDAVSSSCCIGLQLRDAGCLVRIELEMQKEGIVAEFDVPPPSMSIGTKRTQKSNLNTGVLADVVIRGPLICGSADWSRRWVYCDEHFDHPVCFLKTGAFQCLSSLEIGCRKLLFIMQNENISWCGKEYYSTR